MYTPNYGTSFLHCGCVRSLVEDNVEVRLGQYYLKWFDRMMSTECAPGLNGRCAANRERTSASAASLGGCLTEESKSRAIVAHYFRCEK